MNAAGTLINSARPSSPARPAGGARWRRRQSSAVIHVVGHGRLHLTQSAGPPARPAGPIPAAAGRAGGRHRLQHDKHARPGQAGSPSAASAGAGRRAMSARGRKGGPGPPRRAAATLPYRAFTIVSTSSSRSAWSMPTRCPPNFTLSPHTRAYRNSRRMLRCSLSHTAPTVAPRRIISGSA